MGNAERPLSTSPLLLALRVLLISWAVLVAVGAGVYVTAMITSDGIHSPFHELITPDFAIFWGAGRVAHTVSPAAAWDWQILTHEVAHVFGRNAFRVGSTSDLPLNDALSLAEAPAPSWQVAWNYLPPALLPMIPLGFLPYGTGVFVWLSLGVLAWGAAAWRLWPRAEALAAALLYPGVILSLMSGQTGLFVAAGLCGGLYVLPRRPWLAGLLLALVAVKPTMVLLLPVALIAGREWKALLASVVCGIGLVLVTTLVLGFEVWGAFFANLPLVDAWTRDGQVALARLGSPWAWAMAVGLRGDLAALLQAAATSIAVIGIIAAWRRQDRSIPLNSSRHAIRVAVLLTAIPLAPFYIFDYDLVPLCGAILLLWRLSAEPTVVAGGNLKGERPFLMVAWLLTCILPQVSLAVGYYPTTVLIVGLLGCALRRLNAFPK